MTLNSPPIAFPTVALMNDPRTSTQGRNRLAQKVLDKHGVAGLLTLWLSQGATYDVSSRHIFSFNRPGAVWWSQPENPYTPMVRSFLDKLDYEDAQQYLSWATRFPMIDDEVWDNYEDRGFEVYYPVAHYAAGHCDASLLRAQAQCFFPQWSELSEPTCVLYQTTFGVNANNSIGTLTYANPFIAFPELAAHQYLACVLPKNEVAKAGEQWLTFRREKNNDWNMYEQLGLSREEGYQLAKGKVFSGLSMALPEDLTATLDADSLHRDTP